MYNPNLYGMNGLQQAAMQNTFQQPAVNVQPTNQKIIYVHGREGALAQPMKPNESGVYVDDTDNIAWFKVTDEVGFATVKGFWLSPMQEETAPASSDKEKQEVQEEKYVTVDRFNALENKVDKLVEEWNG